MEKELKFCMGVLMWDDLTGHGHPETLAETIESDPLCITDLFQNKISF